MGRRILAVDEKFYATDHAMRRAVTGGNARRDIDRTLEAVVYREFLRRGYDVRIGRIKEPCGDIPRESLVKRPFEHSEV